MPCDVRFECMCITTNVETARREVAGIYIYTCMDGRSVSMPRDENFECMCIATEMRARIEKGSGNTYIYMRYLCRCRVTSVLSVCV